MITLQLHQYEFDILLNALEERKAQAVAEEDYVLANSYKNRIAQHRFTKAENGAPLEPIPSVTEDTHGQPADNRGSYWDEPYNELAAQFDKEARQVAMPSVPPGAMPAPIGELWKQVTDRVPEPFTIEQHVNVIGNIINDRYRGTASTESVLRLLIELGWTAPDVPNLLPPPNAR